MAVREINGNNLDFIRMDASFGAMMNGAYSLVAVVRPYASTVPTPSNVGMAAYKTTGGATLSGLSYGGSDRLALYSDTDDSRVVVGTDSTAWQCCAMTKASGTVAPRFHRANVGTWTWAHGDGGTTVPNNATAVTRFEVDPWWAGAADSVRFATVAIFTTALSDASIEAIGTTPSTQKLKDLGATNLWDFNQASVATAVADLVGTANQTSISGTTVVTGDDPSGWTFGVSSGTTYTKSGLAIIGP